MQRVLAGIVCGVLTLAACSDDGSSSDDQVATTTTAQSSNSSSGTTNAASNDESDLNVQPALDQAALESALLDAADFPTGWARSNVGDDSEERGLCGEPNTFEAHPPVARAQIAFAEDERTGPVAQEVLGSYPNDDDATAAFNSFVTAANSCTSFDDSELGETQVGELSFPSRGDELAAYRLTFEAEGQTLSADLIVFRRGPVLAAITYIGSFIDSDEEQQIVDRAVAKLDAALA